MGMVCQMNFNLILCLFVYGEKAGVKGEIRSRDDLIS